MNEYKYSQPGMEGGLPDAGEASSSSQEGQSWDGLALHRAGGGKGLERLLVLVDFSESSLGGVRSALALAKNQPTTIILLHVIDVKFNWPATGPAIVPKLRQEIWAEAEENMHTVVKSLRQAGVPVQPVITEGVPWKVITTQAKERGVTLIVMGRGGKETGWRPFRRQTARRVAEAVSCPVLTVL